MIRTATRPSRNPATPAARAAVTGRPSRRRRAVRALGRAAALGPRGGALIACRGWRLVPRRARRPLLVAALAAGALGAGYLVWFRDLGVFRVETVTVTGATTREAAKLRAALDEAAREMTVLHVREAALRRAAAPYAAVAGLEVSRALPDTLRIRVIEHRAVAVIDDGAGGRLPLAPDGTILRGVTVPGPLPLVPARVDDAGGRVGAGDAGEAVRIAARAPAPLRARVERVGRRPGSGWVAVMRAGPDLVIGDARALEAKWAAAAAVLADPSVAAATYVDLRLPDRPAVGGLPAEQVPGEPGAGEPESAAPGASAPAGAQAPGATAALSAQAPAAPPAPAATGSSPPAPQPQP